jgi:uncharacterized YccA/Bax inhibitor family protein
MRRRSLFQSSNPYFREERFTHATDAVLDADFETMTVSGAVNKSFLLGAALLAAGAYNFTAGNSLLTWGGAIAGLIFAIIASFRPQKSAIWAPLYAVCEGLFIGGITAMYAALFDGIVFKAVTLTFAVFFVMLALYRSGLIKVTPSFRSGVIMATFGVFLLYMVSILLGFFGINMPMLHDASPLGLLLSLGILGIASLNLLLDFDMFEKGEQHGAPAFMEWFAAMGLLITLVWIYLEILRMVAIFSGRE